MKISRVLQKGRLFCRNMTAKPVPCGDGHDLLAPYWQDVHSGCYVTRPQSWLCPDRSVDVSVIIATYNNADQIQASVASVLNQQTKYTTEVIVINDGSTDGTGRILQQFANYPNARIIHQANAGHSGARNVGIDLCRGAYILFHDGDDTLLPGALEALLDCAYANDADTVAGGYLCRTAAGQTYLGLQYPGGEVTDRETVPGMTCGKLFRRKLFANLAFPENYWYEDSIISQIVLPLSRRIWSIDRPVFTYFLNEAGVSFTSQGKRKAIDSLYVTEALLAERAKFSLAFDGDAYRHFLHMVLLTYHRTAQLDEKVLYGIFLCQRQLREMYFPDFCQGGSYAALEEALRRGSFRNYIWCCETQWVRQKLGR